MIETPRILETEPQHYAAVRRTVPLNEISKIMDPSVKLVLAALEAQNRPPTGPWFTHHLRRPMDFFDFEVCFPVDSPIEPAGEVYPGIWPAMALARTVFHGNYSGLPGAWGELERWMQSEGHPGGTEFWERYTVNPYSEPTPENWRTELNWPLAV